MGNLWAVVVWMYWCERRSGSGIGMEGESRSGSVSRNPSGSVRGCPSVSATACVRVSGSVRETGGEMVVGVGWIDHVKVKLSQELGQVLVGFCLHEQQAPWVSTPLYEK